MSAPQLVVLAGGLGTRLRAVVDDVPKPMAPVNGRPFLEHVLRALARQGFERVLLCVGYRAAQIEQHFGDGSRLGLSIRYAHEPADALLGTAGALRQAGAQLEDRFVVINGDTYLDADLTPLLAAPLSPAGATLGLVSVPDVDRYGTVALDARGRIVRFAEKSQRGPGLINAGVYVMDRRALEALEDGAPRSLERDLFPALVTRGLLGGHVLEGEMTDIGTPESYARFQLRDLVDVSLSESARVLAETARVCGRAITDAAALLVAAYRAGGQSLWCGNGGSASDAQHLVCELVSKLNHERRALPALALGTNLSIVTAIGNDYAFDQVFARQVDAHARPGDVLVAISTSGASASVLEAARRAHARGARVIGLTGRDGGALAALCDVAVIVPSNSTQHIQEAHIAIGHVLCDAIERAAMGDAA